MKGSVTTLPAGSVVTELVIGRTKVRLETRQTDFTVVMLNEL